MYVLVSMKALGKGMTVLHCKEAATGRLFSAMEKPVMSQLRENKQTSNMHVRHSSYNEVLPTSMPKFICDSLSIEAESIDMAQLLFPAHDIITTTLVPPSLLSCLSSKVSCNTGAWIATHK